MKHKGQIAIEFMLLLGMAFVVVIIFLAATFAVFKQNSEIETYNDIDDLGKALQQEFLLAAQMEDGYTRQINLPMTLNGLRYNATIGHYSSTHNYLYLKYENTETEYLIPPIAGNISLGDNLLRKRNTTLTIN